MLTQEMIDEAVAQFQSELNRISEKFTSLKRPTEMTMEEANAEYKRVYDFDFPSTADFRRMGACSRRINELKYGIKEDGE